MNTTSFGHFRDANTPKCRRALTTGIPRRRPRVVTYAGSGFTMRETYSPPGGEAQARPCRPFPALCRFATRIVPSSAPWPRRSFATSFVESTASNRRSRRKIGPGRASTATGCGRDSSATGLGEPQAGLSFWGGGGGATSAALPPDPSEVTEDGVAGDQEEGHGGPGGGP